MEFRILGPLQVVKDGSTIDLGPPQQRALLALLLVHANRVVTTDRILDALWGDETEGKTNALWVYISRLRSTFEPDRGPRGESRVLVTRDHGYVLSAEPDSIDAQSFERQVAEASTILNRDPEAASAQLSEALQLWRGTAFEEFAYYDFAQSEITRLEELRLTAIEKRIEADLRRGKATELVGELESLRQQHPTREGPVAQLMLALYQTGRQAEALRTFTRFRLDIGEELGIEPSPELRRLEEQVLLHDPVLGSRLPLNQRVEPTVRAATNPFKGLRAFYEDDASDFHGRDRVVTEVLKRIEGGERLIALVGPSGSGKSSLVRAGVVPAIRKSAIEGSDRWPVAQMVPGSRPFAELEVGLLRSSLDAPSDLGELLEHPELGILKAALRVIPRDDSRMLLVIDQFEELFTLVEDETERRRFMANLLSLITDPHGRITVLLTLRADFYDRPLSYPEFGQRLGNAVVNVVPLTPPELEDAAQKPVERVNVSVELTLLASLLTDVLGQPGGLPLFQYSLTELFDRRTNNMLTLESYRSMGGLKGALSRRAEDLYAALDPKEQTAAHQVLLRLVSITDGGAEWSRRRVPASEIVSLDVDLVAVQTVIEVFTAHRLLTVDRDLVSASPTVEVAHEALLTEWPRLREWIAESREDVKRHAALNAAMNEWVESGLHPDYLLTGSRLDGYEEWAATAAMQLTRDQQQYLNASIESRYQAQLREKERAGQEEKMARSARRRLWALATAAVIAIGLGAGAFLLAYEPELVQVAVVAPSTAIFGNAGLLETGIANAERDLPVEIESLTGGFTSLDRQYRDLAESGTDLIFLDPDNSGWSYVWDVIADYPDTAFAVIDGIYPPGGAQSVYFADEEAGYVAGVAAALTTETNIVGFVGGHQSDTTERWRAGFETGVLAVNPDIQVLALYVATQTGGFRDVQGGREAVLELYGLGADVVLAMAGNANQGVIEAASTQSRSTGSHLWVIGSDADWSVQVEADLRPHVLASAVRKWDVAIYETIRSFTEGEFAPGSVSLGLAEDAVGLAPSTNLTESDQMRVDELVAELIASKEAVPLAPIGPLLPPVGVDVSETVTVIWDGETCSATTPTMSIQRGTGVQINFVNHSSEYWRFVAAIEPGGGIILSTLVRPSATNTGYVTLFSNILLTCDQETRRYVTEPSVSAEAGVVVVDSSS